MIKVAVIGVGSIGQHHARNYRQSSLSLLTSVADASIEIGQRVAELQDVPFYQDYQEMLDKEKPEAVSIAVPTEAHFPVVQDALNAGCHVLVEKPIAATVEQGKAMIELAQKNKRVLRVGHIERFNPAVVKLKQELQTGFLGPIFQIHARRLGAFPAHVKDVGVILDLAVHDLDIMRYLIDSEAVRLYAETNQVKHKSHEDIFSGNIRFDNGVMGILEINWHTPRKIREIIITGERGMFHVDYLNQELDFYESNYRSTWSDSILLEGPKARYQINKIEPLRAELENFINDIEQNRYQNEKHYHGADGLDGVIALELAQAFIQSGRETKVIHFPAQSISKS